MRVKASALNVRSGPGTQFRVLGTLPRGAEVGIRETYDGWSWIESRRLPLEGWVAARYLGEELASGPAPHGLPAIQAFFGPPGGPQATSGRVVLPAPLKIGWLRDKINAFACHKKVEGAFQRVFNRIYEEGLWGELKTFDGCYNDRSIKGSSKQSTHAWGISVDLNAFENPVGTRGKMHPRIVEIFEEEGFIWGGRFSRPDPMHFQFASGY